MRFFNWRDETGSEDYALEKIRDRAQRKQGGVTTTFMLKHKLRTLIQKWNVGSEIELVDATHKGNVYFKAKDSLSVKLWDEDKMNSFKQEVIDIIHDCGYAIRVSEEYTELSPA